jgi:hypothetical protein
MTVTLNSLMERYITRLRERELDIEHLRCNDDASPDVGQGWPPCSLDSEAQSLGSPNSRTPPEKQGSSVERCNHLLTFRHHINRMIRSSPNRGDSSAWNMAKMWNSNIAKKAVLPKVHPSILETLP